MARKVSFSALESRSARLTIEHPPQALQRSVARARHRADVPPQQDQRHMGAEGQRRPRRILDQGLRPGRRLRGCRRQERADVHQAQDQAKKLARGDDGGAGQRTDHRGWRADRLQDRSDIAQCQSLQRRLAAPASHQRAVVEAGGVAHGHRAEEMARRPAGHDGTVDRSIGFAVACAPRWSRPRSTTSAIQNREAWEIGLAGLPNAQQARNVILSDDKVREFVAAAYGLDDQFGLLTDTLAVTGARPSQAVRLRVEDLHDHPVRPKLMMPKSAKGGDRNRSEKKPSAIRCRSPLQLATKLRAAAKGRADDAPLLLQGDGSPWGDNPGAELSSRRRQDRHRHRCRSRGDDVRLRHSSIVRMLLQNVPIRLVASLHNTSVSDDRKALFEIHHRAQRRHLAPRAAAP